MGWNTAALRQPQDTLDVAEAALRLSHCIIALLHVPRNCCTAVCQTKNKKKGIMYKIQNNIIHNADHVHFKIVYLILSLPAVELGQKSHSSPIFWRGSWVRLTLYKWRLATLALLHRAVCFTLSWGDGSLEKWKIKYWKPHITKDFLALLEASDSRQLNFRGKMGSCKLFGE